MFYAMWHKTGSGYAAEQTAVIIRSADGKCYWNLTTNEFVLLVPRF